MEIINVNIHVVKAFGNLHRSKCVLIAVKNQDGSVLTGAKPTFFPPGITRLLGGGVDEGENVELAAIRELKEELDVIAPAEELLPVAQFSTTAIDIAGRKYHNETYVYSIDIGDAPYQPGDDVKQIVALDKRELQELANAYDSLPESLWYRGEEGDFSWRDYGQMYSIIHRTVADKVF